MSATKVEFRAVVRWTAGQDTKPLIVAYREGETTDALRVRARQAVWMRLGAMTKGTPSDHEVVIQQRTVTPWEDVA